VSNNILRFVWRYLRSWLFVDFEPITRQAQVILSQSYKTAGFFIFSILFYHCVDCARRQRSIPYGHYQLQIVIPFLLVIVFGTLNHTKFVSLSCFDTWKNMDSNDNDDSKKVSSDRIHVCSYPTKIVPSNVAKLPQIVNIPNRLGVVRGCKVAMGYPSGIGSSGYAFRHLFGKTDDNDGVINLDTEDTDCDWTQSPPFVAGRLCRNVEASCDFFSEGEDAKPAATQSARLKRELAIEMEGFTPLHDDIISGSNVPGVRTRWTRNVLVSKTSFGLPIGSMHAIDRESVLLGTPGGSDVSISRDTTESMSESEKKRLFRCALALCRRSNGEGSSTCSDDDHCDEGLTYDEAAERVISDNFMSMSDGERDELIKYVIESDLFPQEEKDQIILAIV
jgi:hypothetical protein